MSMFEDKDFKLLIGGSTSGNACSMQGGINMILFYVRVYSGYYAGHGNSRLLFRT